MKLTAILNEGEDYEKGKFENKELSVLLADKIMKKFSLQERKQIKIRVILRGKKK